MLLTADTPNIGLSEMLQMARIYSEPLSTWTTVGASGAVYAILLAFGMTFPEERIFIFPLPIPIKAKWFVIFYAVVELVQALAMPGDGVAHLAHLGGMIIGFFLIRYWNNHPTAGYGRDNGRMFFDSLRGSWEQRKQQYGNGNRTRHNNNSTRHDNNTGSNNTSSTRSGNPDWDYNARQKANQAEIDRILDKIRKNGYDSLTKEEKQRLFDESSRK